VSDATSIVTADGDAVVVAVHVQPRAGRSAVVGRHGDALKIRVAAPPVDDRANEAVLALVGEVLDLPVSQLEIVGGRTSRLKRVRARDVDLETALERVDRALEAAAEPPGPHQRRAR